MISITIDTNLDFTPAGKRSARWVYASRGVRQHRWYVGGRLYSKRADPSRTAEWLAGEGKPGHCPQPWGAFA